MSLLEPPANLVRLLRSHEDIKEEEEEVIAYVAFLAAGLAQANEYDPSVWIDVLGPYLLSSASIPDFCRDAQRELSTDDAESYGDVDEQEEIICDLRFNLAYGGKILLHRTHLRLVKGRRYALVGQNGVGKTTLMNAINNGKLDGWPSHLTCAYVDSGSNVDPAYEAQNVMDHVMASTKRTKEDCIQKMKEQEFTASMMEGQIGELSGGWQMKLRLIRAILMDPDIYLLDEPTNHLSASAVQWITDYLLGLTDQTVICVSHDTHFLQKICTDVIHYEQRPVWGPYRKLVHYKGKMSEFVELQPQAKHYFELATTDHMEFHLPDPGRLEGVKTSTQKFLEMEHVDFRYPGNTENTLTGIHLKMTLSSRVAVLGSNGAGKTTLVRMIVGETLPSNLGVCKYYVHPNLRVAYVAQHAFYHVEQHMEESPAAYIQWRFKDGFDKGACKHFGVVAEIVVCVYPHVRSTYQRSWTARATALLRMKQRQLTTFSSRASGVVGFVPESWNTR